MTIARAIAALCFSPPESSEVGWGLLRTPYGWGAFKEGHGDGFQHYAIVFPESDLGVLLLRNSDNAESLFDHLLTITIADTYTPLEWEGYVPFR